MEIKKMFKSVKILFVFVMYFNQVTTNTLQDQREYCAKLLSQYDPELLASFKWEMSHGIERFFLLSYCLACCWPGLGAKSDLRIVKQWAELDFVFPSQAAQKIAIQRNYYTRGSSVPIDVDVNHREGIPSRIFVTFPRFGPGRPVTLGTVQPDGRIKGYPDYSWHDNQGYNCAGLTSVFRVAIDECQRLWVMDTGKIGETQSCPPQLLAFDLTTDKLIYRHVVNQSSYSDLSLFITPVLDIRSRGAGDCTFTYVYVADVSDFGLLVVDVMKNRSWKVSHRLFYPYPSRGTFNVAGETFDLMDGVIGLALSPYKPGSERNLFFHALASTTENVVSTRVLRNDSYASTKQLERDDVFVYPEERPTQSAAQAMDSNGIMYFGMMNPPAIYCWNTATEFSPRNFHVLAIDEETLQFASGVKIVINTKGEEELWVLTSSFQRVMTGTITSDRINYRIHAENLSILLQRSACKGGKQKPWSKSQK